MTRRFQFSFEPKGEFTLDDFRRMLAQPAKLGLLSKIMDLLPGMNALKASEIIQLVKQFDGMADVMRHMRRPRLDPD